MYTSAHQRCHDIIDHFVTPLPWYYRYNALQDVTYAKQKHT